MDGSSSTKHPAPGDHPIVFFDGVCGLCNGFVDFMIRADRQAVLRFAPLQGETARRLLPELPESTEEWSINLWEQGRLHRASDAALLAAVRMGGVFRLARIFLIIPTGWRNGIYRWVARNRYRWFGKKESCRIPSPAERDRFLP